MKLSARGDCLIWTGAKNTDGYGVFRREGDRAGSLVLAHRFYYELTRGPIPAGLELDHTCNTRDCVKCTEAVTHSVNMKRAYARRRLISA
jgi:hypothetical protein